MMRRNQLRTIGIIVLLLGISSAWLVYRMGTRAPDLRNDPLLAGYDKQERWQMGVLFGKMGLLMVDLLDALKRPGTQAIIIAAISTLIAFGCFYVAQMLPHDSETTPKT